MTSRRLVSFVTFAVLLLLPFVAIEACGPDFQPDTFVRAARPDDSKTFAEGQLGILQPGFDSNDLAIAYRYLNGGKLSDKEQAIYVAPTQPNVVTPEKFEAAHQAEEAAQPVNQWKAARAKYATPDGEITPEHQAPQELGGNNVYYYPDYLNCPNAAFKTAVLTVNSRAATWGAQSPYLKDWITAQDAVFSNCSGKTTTMPPPPPQNSPALLRADRAYQAAAAAFYAGKYDEARFRFQNIAQDKSSPWQPWGEYLAARALVRLAFSEGTKNDPWSGNLATFNPQTMRKAQQMLEALLKQHDPALSSQTILDELNFVRMRTEPGKRIAEVATALAGPAPDPTFQQDLKDLNYAFYKKIQITDLPPLFAWIVALRAPAAGNAALAAWQQSHALPWLVAALSLAHPKDAGVADLLTAASGIEGSSPAFDTVTYHRVRLLIGLDRSDEARGILDQVLASLRRQQPSSALNAFLGQRMQVTRDFNEFLTFAPRTVLEMNSEGAGAFLDAHASAQGPTAQPAPLQFDEDATNILNRQTPLHLLVEAARSANLPPNLRQDVALAAWVRSVLLGDNTSAAALSPHLPESIQKTAGTSTGFPAVLAILRNPGLRPYLEPGVSRLASYSFLENYRDNWWCGNSQRQYYAEQQKPSAPSPVTFLTTEEQKTAEAEYQRLTQLPCAPAELGERVIDYAKDHPSDPDLPEALALTVRATHFGWLGWSQDKEGAAKNTAVSKAAFQLLHNRYPSSPWTAKTPYYY
jgi:hypothetical protein